LSSFVACDERETRPSFTVPIAAGGDSENDTHLFRSKAAISIKDVDDHGDNDDNVVDYIFVKVDDDDETAEDNWQSNPSFMLRRRELRPLGVMTVTSNYRRSGRRR
jgi:hypothetical protein